MIASTTRTNKVTGDAVPSITSHFTSRAPKSGGPKDYTCARSDAISPLGCWWAMALSQLSYKLQARSFRCSPPPLPSSSLSLLFLLPSTSPFLTLLSIATLNAISRRDPLTLNQLTMKSTAFFFSTLSLILLLPLTEAHGIVGQVTIDGTPYQGPIAGGASAPGSPIRQITSASPVKGATNKDMTCGPGATPASFVAPANPGSAIDVLWTANDRQHWPHNTGLSLPLPS